MKRWQLLDSLREFKKKVHDTDRRGPGQQAS